MDVRIRRIRYAIGRVSKPQTLTPKQSRVPAAVSGDVRASELLWGSAFLFRVLEV